MEETRFIKVMGRNSRDTIILPISSIKTVFTDEGGTFIVTEDWRKNNCCGYYVCETVLEIADKLGAV